MALPMAMLRDEPGLLAMVALLAIGLLVFGLLALLARRSGAGLRPVLFVGGMFALVLLPQLAFHLGVATGAIPRRDRTWLPAAERARVHGWVENEAALAIRDGRFLELAAVFGRPLEGALATDLRASGGATPFGRAEAAALLVRPPEGSVVVARFADAAAAEAAARAHAAASIGVWPPIDGDGLRSATRPAGDRVGLAVVGRTLVVVSDASGEALLPALLALGAIAPGPAALPADPGSAEFWLFRPGVLPVILVSLGLLTVWAWFRGVVWAGSVPPAQGVAPVEASVLRQRLLAIAGADVPFTIEQEGWDGRLVVGWRFADARWLDRARVRRLRAEQRLLLELDPAAHRVRVMEQQTRFEADAGRGGASLAWQTARGFTFLEVQGGRVFGLQLDADGRPKPDPDYAWRFSAVEMKAPLIDAVTRAGWEWRPTPWRGPEWLRWLTD